MSTLHPPSAMPTAPHMDAKFNTFYPWFRNLGLVLRNRLAFLEFASASGTPRGQGHFHNFIDLIRQGPTITSPILPSWFASWFFGSGFGFLPREGGRLPLPGSQRLFQQALQACVFFFQCFDLTFEPRNFFRAILFCHTDKLAGLRMKTTNFASKVPRR